MGDERVPDVKDRTMPSEEAGDIDGGSADTQADKDTTNPYVRPKIDIAQCLQNAAIPEKDKIRLRELQAELHSEGISKNRRKKLWKEVEWVANRKRRNNEKKAERKKRQLEIREGVREAPQKRQRIVRMSDSACKVRVALDLSLHDLMTEVERMKAGKQTQRCYAMNRLTDRPLQLYLTGLEGTEYWTGKMPGFDNWDVHRVQPGHVAHFGKEQIVYLSGDSENEIDELLDSEVYIIGCMVDHNRLKGVTHQRALEAGVRHARLPLDKYVDMKTRKVLTIDHCFEILLNRVNGMSWKDAIIKAIPARKGAQVKDTTDDEAADCTENDLEDDPDNETLASEPVASTEAKESGDDAQRISPDNAKVVMDDLPKENSLQCN